MRNFESRYDTIQAYLKDQLIGDEKKAFEQELKNDPELEAEVESHQIAFLTVQHAYLSDMSDLVKDQMKAGARKSKKLKLLLAGLGVCLLSSVIIFWMNSTNSETLVTVLKVESDSLHYPTEKKVPKQAKDTFPVIKNPVIRKVIVDEQRENLNTPVETKVKIDTPILKRKATLALPDEKVVDEHQSEIEQKQATATNVNDTTPKIPQPDCSYDGLKVETKGASLGQEDGELILEYRKGLTYVINEGEWESQESLTGLGSRKYHVRMYDDVGCDVDLGTYTILQSDCMAQKDFAYNQMEGALEISVNENKSAEVILMDRTGRTVFSRSLENEDVFSWDGEYLDGQSLGLGLHKLFINYSTSNRCIYNIVITQ